MDDRLSGFCGGVGLIGLLLWGAYLTGGTAQVGLVTAVLMGWGLLASVLIGIACLDWWWDERKR